ncbi:polymorphic toxin type 33 domain-containing protein [Apibacter sp. HY039]|uniref:polymorphic toxin type 33 domain-containing protein n=1 Tax=Apibacter sp. HY039 TaxID=2501476 RepID=UPI001C87F5DF|nr:polymorphic toxin type 33 domain-containing protein [Apibacter sp. HY039]
MVHKIEKITFLENTGGDPNPNRNWRQDKLLSKGEIEKLQEAGWDHSDKGKGGGKKDLYKDKEGNVYEKPKGGNGPGEWTGHNLNNLSTSSLLNKMGGDGLLKIMEKAAGSLIRVPVIPEIIFMMLDDGLNNKQLML